MEPKSVVEPVQEVLKEVNAPIVITEPVFGPIEEVSTIVEVIKDPIIETVAEPTASVSKIETVQTKDIVTEGVTPITDVGDGYVKFGNGVYNKKALKEIRPDLFSIRVDNGVKSSTNFGSQFPKIAAKGDIFVRVDVLPNRVFKFDGIKWIEQNKSNTQSYLYNKDYIEFLIEKINLGEYDLDTLNEEEKSEIETYLNNSQNN